MPEVPLPVPVVPDGPAPVAPVLPEVPSPVALPDMPAPDEPVLPDPVLPAPLLPALPDMPPPAEPLVEPDDPVAPVPPAVPAVLPSEVVPAAVPPEVVEPVVEPPDMVPLLPLPTLPVEGEAVVLGVVALLVDAPGVVVSAARRSHPISAALITAVASMALDNLDSDGIWTPWYWFGLGGVAQCCAVSCTASRCFQADCHVQPASIRLRLPHCRIANPTLRSLLTQVPCQDSHLPKALRNKRLDLIEGAWADAGVKLTCNKSNRYTHCPCRPKRSRPRGPAEKARRCRRGSAGRGKSGSGRQTGQRIEQQRRIALGQLLRV